MCGSRGLGGCSVLRESGYGKATYFGTWCWAGCSGEGPLEAPPVALHGKWCTRELCEYEGCGGDVSVRTARGVQAAVPILTPDTQSTSIVSHPLQGPRKPPLQVALTSVQRLLPLPRIMPQRGGGAARGLAYRALSALLPLRWRPSPAGSELYHGSSCSASVRALLGNPPANLGMTTCSACVLHRRRLWPANEEADLWQAPAASHQTSMACAIIKESSL